MEKLKMDEEEIWTEERIIEEIELLKTDVRDLIIDIKSRMLEISKRPEIKKINIIN